MESENLVTLSVTVQLLEDIMLRNSKFTVKVEDMENDLAGVSVSKIF